MAKRKCKRCGRRFESKGPGDCFCSPICRMTGFFIGGGGDTSKPGVPQAHVIPQPKPVRVRKDDERYARVRQMFAMPAGERWGIAKDFTADERAYAKRISRRMMMEEVRFTREWTWDGGSDDADDSPFDGGGMLGESDDGSV